MNHLLWLWPSRRRWFARFWQGESLTRRRISSPRWSRPWLELLEDRIAPAVFNLSIDPSTNPSGAVQELVSAINTANNNGQSNTINLFAGGVYDLTAINNYWYGPDGLPPITSTLTINGNGATIQRDVNAIGDFRLFYVSGGLSGELPLGHLTLENVTLQGGIAKGGDSGFGGGGLGAGGAIFNQGTVNLDGITVTNNQAQGGGGGVLFFGNPLGNGGGGMGEDAPNASGEENEGGGFGGALTGGPFGGAGGQTGTYYNGGQLEGYSGGGGGGFLAGANGQNGSPSVGGNGGGLGGFGGSGGAAGSGGTGGDGGGGGWGPVPQGFGPPGGGSFGSRAGVLGGGGVGGGGGGAAYVTTGGQFTYDNAGGGGFGGGGGGGGSGGGGGFGGAGGGANTSAGGTAGPGGFGGGKGGSDGGGGAAMGGGIFSMFGTLTLTNCTLTGNTATGGSARAGSGATGGSGLGGAIFNLDGQLQITFSTLAHNAASDGSGGTPQQAEGTDVYNLADGNNINNGGAVTATATITDSILSNPQSGSDLWSFAVNGNHTNTASVALDGQNVIMFFGAAITGSHPITSDPQLGPLQNNGGPTQTMAIAIGSPALLAGTPVAGVTTDQRGQSRPGDPSLGAFEPQFVTTTAAFNATATFSQSAQDVTLSANVFNVGPGNVNDGTVTFTVKHGSTVIGLPVTSGTVNDNSASATYVLPANTPPATYTIDAVYNPGGGFVGSSDNLHTLTVSPAAIAMVVPDAMSTYNESPQNVTLTANVTSSAGTVKEGTVTFTLKQGNTTVGPVVTSGTVTNGEASVNYVLPADTPAGNYTIEADYSDSSGNFLPHSGQASQQINPAASALDLTTVQIVPNLLSATAQVTLTAQMSSPAGGVFEGAVNFSLAGVSGQGGISNGTASVQLVVPVSAVAGNQAAALAYTDFAAPADFIGSNAANTLSLASWNALLPSRLTFAADGSETNTASDFGVPLTVHYTSQGVSAGSSFGLVSSDPGNGGVAMFAFNIFGWPIVVYIDIQELEAAIQLAASMLYPPEPTVVTDLLSAVSPLYPPEPIFPPNPLVTAVQFGPFDFFFANGALTGIEEH
jgi:hypothetical protein